MSDHNAKFTAIVKSACDQSDLYGISPRRTSGSELASNINYRLELQIRDAFRTRNLVGYKHYRNQFGPVKYNSAFPWQHILGYNGHNLVKYFNDQYPEWRQLEAFEIHHIIPVRMFPFVDPTEELFRRCFDKKNLIPLSPEEHKTIHQFYWKARMPFCYPLDNGVLIVSNNNVTQNHFIEDPTARELLDG